jgi:hypothetical protein
MRAVLTGCLLAVFGIGCASAESLRQQSDEHLQLAQKAARAGEYERAKAEQRRAEYLFDRAAVRAYEEGRPSLPPPQTAPPLPLVNPM